MAIGSGSRGIYHIQDMSTQICKPQKFYAGKKQLLVEIVLPLECIHSMYILYISESNNFQTDNQRTASQYGYKICCSNPTLFAMRHIQRHRYIYIDIDTYKDIDRYRNRQKEVTFSAYVYV